MPGRQGDDGFLPDDRLTWLQQPKMAAILAKGSNHQVQELFNQLPIFKELFFLQLVGDAALTALKTPKELAAK